MQSFEQNLKVTPGNFISNNWQAINEDNKRKYISRINLL